MTAKLGSLVTAAATALGSPLDGPTCSQVTTWLSRLKQWNARIDLTAARSDEELVDLMLADAIVLGQRLPERARVVDVGTGAGAPGLALALVRPDTRLTLAEPLGKRSSFLRSVIGELDRTDVAIERARGEALPHGAWEVAVSRATVPPAAWLAMGTRLVAGGGVVWVLVAHDDAPLHPGATLEADLHYAWPLTGVARRALGYRVAGPAARA
jgi:16S rRNA (guanine527-N7)-methyltransferase